MEDSQSSVDVVQKILPRFRKLPHRPQETWQGKIVRMPAWISGEGKPYRPWMPLWLAIGADKIHSAPPMHRREATKEKMALALFQFGLKSEFGGYRPGRIEVADPDLALYLQDVLADCQIDVRRLEDLPQVDAVMKGFKMAHASGKPEAPSVLDGPGVTLEHLRRYAHAAEEFYQASPWLHLCDVDLIEIHSPSPPRDMEYVSVLGAGRCMYGLGFYRDHDHLYEFRQGPRQSSLWQLSFNAMHKVPIEDADIWEDHQLPVADENAYPMLAKMSLQRIERADAAELGFVEGLLKALAQTTEEQIDSGQWSITVQQENGDQKFQLSIPDLLHPPTRQQWMERGFMPDSRGSERMFLEMERYFEANPASSVEEMNEILNERFTGKTPEELAKTPETPQEHAAACCYNALDTFGRRRVQLARQALQHDPCWPEAHIILGEQSATLPSQYEHYKQAMEHAAEKLGVETFRQLQGQFWGVTKTRPYMRARLGLAQTLEQMGRFNEAIAHYRRMLELNPGDNQGVRYLLMARLLKDEYNAEAVELLADHDDVTAFWKYAEALLAFRRDEGDVDSRQSLQEAFSGNPYVPEILEADEPTTTPDHFSLGSSEEAAYCLCELGPAFAATPGFIDWVIRENDRWRALAVDD